MISDKEKIKIIHAIDILKYKYQNTIYFREIMMMRKKYIYKDICNEQYLRDKKWVKDLYSMSKIKIK